MSSAKVFRGMGLLVGMIVGAGMFALPYAVWRAGMWWGLFHFMLAGFLVTTIHLLYGRILFRNHMRHRLPGYVRAYMGEGAYEITLWFRLFAYFGYLLAYGVLGGLFLEHFFSGVDSPVLVYAFLCALAPLIGLELAGAGAINFMLSIPLGICVFVLAFFLLQHATFEPAHLTGESGNWFLPYGIFLFAFSGASVIPDVADLFKKNEERAFRKTVILSSVVVACLYALFIVAVLGAAHGVVSEDGLSPILAAGGEKLFLLASCIGLLAVVTSYIALGLELRLTLQYDLKFGWWSAWLVTAATPMMLYMVGVQNLVLILGLTGAVGVGVEGIAIVLLGRRVLATSRAYTVLLASVFVVGAAFEIAKTVGIL